MRKIVLRRGPAVLFMSLTMLALSIGLRAQSEAAKVYKANCAPCHGPDGSGNTPTGKALKVKDLSSDEVQKQTDAALAEVIAKGKGQMPAFQAKLSPDVIKSLVVYVRQLAKKK